MKNEVIANIISDSNMIVKAGRVSHFNQMYGALSERPRGCDNYDLPPLIKLSLRLIDESSKGSSADCNKAFPGRVVINMAFKVNN